MDPVLRRGRISGMSRGVKDVVGKMNVDIKKHEVSQLLNPFSNSYDATYANASLPEKTDAEYGRPARGSKTEARALEAAHHIQREVELLLQIIASHGTVDPVNGLKFIKFGVLFKIYDKISDKVVGILMRARKLGLVAFQGEMLYQRRDDHEPIYLLFYGDPAEFFGGRVSNGSISVNFPDEKIPTTNTSVQNNVKTSPQGSHPLNLNNNLNPSKENQNNSINNNPKGNAKPVVGQHVINKSISDRTGSLLKKMDEYDIKGVEVDNAPKLSSKKVTTPTSQIEKSEVSRTTHKPVIIVNEYGGTGERRNSIVDRAKNLVENMERDAAKGAIPGTQAKVSHPDIKPLKVKAIPPSSDSSKIGGECLIDDIKSHEQRVAASTPITERTAALFDKLEKYSSKGALPGTEAKVVRPSDVKSSGLQTPESKIRKSSPPAFTRDSVNERTSALFKKMGKNSAKGAIPGTEAKVMTGRRISTGIDVMVQNFDKAANISPDRDVGSSGKISPLSKATTHNENDKQFRDRDHSSSPQKSSSRSSSSSSSTTSSSDSDSD